jgi:hypothetical protein
MLEHYKLAEKVIVFSGDFSWIRSNEYLKEEMYRLAKLKKLSLISYKSEEIVKTAIEDEKVFDYFKSKARFHFNSNKKIKCSLVQIRGNLTFLYNSDQTPCGGKNKVCVIYSNNSGRALLDILGPLCLDYERET